MESNTWCQRLTARIILSGSAVHVKGFGSALCSTTKRLMASCKSTTDTKTPRFNRRWVSVAKKPSTALSQDAEARGVCLIVQEAVITRLHEAFLPAPHAGLRFAGPAHDLIGANTVRTQQDDLSPPDMLVWGVAIPRERLQTAAISGLESNEDSGSHAPDSHASSPLGIPSGIQMSDVIH
jgi:hypothetical protein